MQEIEPYYNWQHLYTSEEDELSPFYGIEYNEFEFTNTIYNYYIHPHWDTFGSQTLYLKILMADYEANYAIIEMIGEWNDAIENDIMRLKREVIDQLIRNGITKFILITENVLNFHSSDDSYYEEWFEDIEEENGWIISLNMPEATQHDFLGTRINNYINLIDYAQWRTMKPELLFHRLDNIMLRRLD